MKTVVLAEGRVYVTGLLLNPEFSKEYLWVINTAKAMRDILQERVCHRHRLVTVLFMHALNGEGCIHGKAFEGRTGMEAPPSVVAPTKRPIHGRARPQMATKSSVRLSVSVPRRADPRARAPLSRVIHPFL